MLVHQKQIGELHNCVCCGRVLPQPSQVLAVSLPRPMGVIVEEDAQRGRVIVSGFQEGSPAEKRAKVGTCIPSNH